MDKGQVDFNSMDGSALLGLGILLEEAAEHVLSTAGDMVFVEGKKEGSDDVFQGFSEGRNRLKETSAAAQRLGDTRRGKRRKTRHVSDDIE